MSIYMGKWSKLFFLLLFFFADKIYCMYFKENSLSSPSMVRLSELVKKWPRYQQWKRTGVCHRLTMYAHTMFYESPFTRQHYIQHLGSLNRERSCMPWKHHHITPCMLIAQLEKHNENTILDVNSCLFPNETCIREWENRMLGFIVCLTPSSLLLGLVYSNSKLMSKYRPRYGAKM